MSERLSPIETVMWRAGQDPTLRMTIGTLVVLDQSPSRDALVARLEAAVSEVPRLAAHPERLAAGPGRPTWTADDDHAVEYHVRSLALAAPDRREICWTWSGCWSRCRSTRCAHPGT